jgi:hypothetical protein
MKVFFLFTLVFIVAISCKTKNFGSDAVAKKSVVGDTVKIVNEALEYEVIIIDPGFTTWLASRSFPRGYHSETFLENKNWLYVTEWNNRATQPLRYDPNLYEMQINYDKNIHYGYEVNYLIYNYMIFFQNTYNQQLFGYVPIR